MPWIFLRNYWQYIAIAAIIAVLYIRIQIITSERDSALQTIADMQQAALKKNAEVALLNAQGKQATDALQASHIADIQHIGALYGQQINNDQKSIDNYRNQLANQLREQASNSDSGLPDNVTDNATGNDSNAAIVRPIGPDADYKMMYLGAQSYIETLEKAGAVCASDFNLCRDYVLDNQKRIGVTKE